MGLDFPNLPYLIDGNVKITETLAIHQYLADKWDKSLGGPDPKTRAKTVMVANVIMDLKKAVSIPLYRSGSKEESIKMMNE